MSQDLALQLLKDALAQYRSILDEDPRRFRAVLRDCFRGQAKTELNLLLLALDQGATAELLKPNAVPGIEIGRLSQRLVANFGMQEHLARWSVEAWAVALGLIGQISAAPASADTRPCPFCAEPIRKDAIKCRFCGEYLQPSSIPSPPSSPVPPPAPAPLKVRPQTSHPLPPPPPPSPAKKPIRPPGYLQVPSVPAPPSPVSSALVKKPMRPAGYQTPDPHPHNSLGMEFVLIGPGSFMMGSPASEVARADDELQHPVGLLKAFYLQITPVTQGQWQALTGSNPSRRTGDDRLPVDNVSWLDCQRLIQMLNRRGEGVYRLPTEAEWEYACRAGTATPFGIGNGHDLDASLANFDGRYPYGRGLPGVNRDRSTPVASFAPNAWGLHDMHGNVWEWCQDWYAPYLPRPQSDPQGPELGRYRVLRGGSWDYGAGSCRSAARDQQPPDYTAGDVGLRLVRES